MKVKIRYQNSSDMYKVWSMLLKEQKEGAPLSHPSSPRKDVINSHPDTTLKRDLSLPVHPFDP